MARPQKVHHFQIKPFVNSSGTKSWRVTGSKADGTRIRQNYSERTAALQAMADLEAEYDGMEVAPKVQRTRLRSDEIADAEAALLQADGRKLAKIVSHYRSLEARCIAKGISLDQAIAFSESHYRSEIKTITVLNAYQEFLENKPFGSSVTKAHYENCLSSLLKVDPNKDVHTFTVSDIEKIISRYKNLNSRDTYRRAFAAFFNWCIRHHYCTENPCSRLDKIPRDMSQIAILSIDELKRMLYTAATYQNGVLAATIAIGLFAGLRPSEIEQLKPEQIMPEGIRVTGGKLRRQLNRTAPIPEVLKTWLAEFPFEGTPDGLKYKMRQIKKATNAKKWVHDVIRHTSISYQTERDKNEALTAYNNGTSKRMMDLHYRNTVGDKKLLTDFWELTPQKVLARKPDIKLPGASAIDWPSKAKLEKLVWAKPLTHAAKEIGVSDVALKKRCVKLGIELPRQGHWLKR